MQKRTPNLYRFLLLLAPRLCIKLCHGSAFVLPNAIYVTLPERCKHARRRAIFPYCFYINSVIQARSV
uniref:Putative secreted protein n=1 Tax=Ixodes ricinus TaxID=34613 RepID=A0A6B0TWN4_IXORI